MKIRFVLSYPYDFMGGGESLGVWGSEIWISRGSEIRISGGMEIYPHLS